MMLAFVAPPKSLSSATAKISSQMFFLCRDTELNIGQGLSVLYFYATWFPLYRKITQILLSLEKAYPEFHFYAIDVAQFPSYIKRFELTSLPTILFRREKGKKVGKNLAGLPAIFNASSVLADIYQRRNTQQRKAL
jgi:thiol-disulfide isomerase/thioredoxin